jgi:hypothetical protein
VFANLTHQLHRDLPREPLTRIVNLAAVAMGILRSKSLQVGQIVTASPLGGSRATRKKRVQRFLKNPSVRVEEDSQPLAKRILRRLVAGGARVPLTLDRTEWSDFNLLYVCVGWRGRALPLLWTPLGPGASSFAEQKALLAVVASWLPPGARVLLLGDRELGTGVLAQRAVSKVGACAYACAPMSISAGRESLLRDAAPGAARRASLLVPGCLHPKTCGRRP